MKHVVRGATAAVLGLLLFAVVPRTTSRQVDRVMRESAKSTAALVRAFEGPPYKAPPPPPWWVRVLSAAGFLLVWAVIVAAGVALLLLYVWMWSRVVGAYGGPVGIVILLLSVLVGTQLGRCR